MYTECILIVLI